MMMTMMMMMGMMIPLLLQEMMVGTERPLLLLRWEGIQDIRRTEMLLSPVQASRTLFISRILPSHHPLVCA